MKQWIVLSLTAFSLFQILLQICLSNISTFLGIVINCYQNKIISFPHSLSPSLSLSIYIYIYIYITCWPSTELSIKRCTCVNKRKQVGIKQKYNQDTDSLSQLEIGCHRSENQLQTEDLGPQKPTVEQTCQNAKEVPLWSEKLWFICSSLSPSPTHLSHTTNINPFENKVWEVYFYKEVCSFVHRSRHCCWLCFRMYYVYVCGSTTHTYIYIYMCVCVCVNFK